MEAPVARVLALGREGEEEVLPALEPAGLEARQELLAGRARVGGGLEHDQLPGPQAAGDLLGGRADVGEVGLAVPPERGGDADDDGVALAEAVEVGGGLDAAAREGAPRRARAPMCRMYDSPRCRASGFFGSTSKPTTGKPASSKRSASGRPT